LTVGGRAELLGRDQGAERLAMAGLPAALPPRGRGRRLALQADRVRGGRLGGVGRVESEPGLEIADRGLHRGDPLLEGFPGGQEGGLGVGGHGAPEGLRDRKLLAHMQYYENSALSVRAVNGYPGRKLIPRYPTNSRSRTRPPDEPAYRPRPRGTSEPRHP